MRSCFIKFSLCFNRLLGGEEFEKQTFEELKYEIHKTKRENARLKQQLENRKSAAPRSDPIKPCAKVKKIMMFRFQYLLHSSPFFRKSRQSHHQSNGVKLFTSPSCVPVTTPLDWWPFLSNHYFFIEKILFTCT